MTEQERTEKKQEFIDIMRKNETCVYNRDCACSAYCTSKENCKKLLEKKLFFWQSFNCAIENVEYYIYLDERHKREKGLLNSCNQLQQALYPLLPLLTTHLETAKKMELNAIGEKEVKTCIEELYRLVEKAGLTDLFFSKVNPPKSAIDHSNTLF